MIRLNTIQTWGLYCFTSLYICDRIFLSLRPSLPSLCISLTITCPHLSSSSSRPISPVLSFHSLCPSPALPGCFECFGFPLVCLLTCGCVSRRLRGLASGSLSQAGGITLTFRAGRRPSSYLMCWREVQPRACCSKTHLWPSLPGECQFSSSLTPEFEFNSILIKSSEN